MPNQQQTGFVLWFTGLSQSGKTTLANEIHKALLKEGLKVERLDGDVVRKYLNHDLGYSKKDRETNLKRVSFVAKVLSRNRVGVVASFISPYQKTRNNIRKETTNFIEIFCNAPLEVCEKRDKKGQYKKAREGKIKNFTGVSDPYEKPKNPEIELFTDKESVEESTEKVISYLREKKFI
jgi:adenylyl-sulfate kinase